MASDEESEKKVQYKSYEEFRRKFYGSGDRPKTKDPKNDDDTASFGKRLASELVRQK